MARYSLVVLKVPLNINQPTNLSKQKLCFVRPIVGWDMWKNLVATLEHYERWPDEICLASHAVNLRSSSNCDLVVPRTSRKIDDRASLCCRTACMESAADRLETHEFDCFIQKQTEEFSVSCCLHREHCVNSVMRHRSDRRRRTTSHCCYCYSLRKLRCTNHNKVSST